MTPTNCTAFFAGTSQATPQVAAAAALLLAAAGGHHSLTPAHVTQLIEDTADNINDPHQGHGRLNVYKALAAVNGDTGAVQRPDRAEDRARRKSSRSRTTTPAGRPRTSST